MEEEFFISLYVFYIYCIKFSNIKIYISLEKCDISCVKVKFVYML